MSGPNAPDVTLVSFFVGEHGQDVYLFDHTWVARVPGSGGFARSIVERAREIPGLIQPVPPFALAQLEPRSRETADDVIARTWLMQAGARKRTPRMERRGEHWTLEIAGVHIAQDLAVHSAAIAQFHQDDELFAHVLHIGLPLPAIALSGRAWSILIAPLARPTTSEVGHA